MRDMMAITALPEVISLAGGLPDTSTFPPETFASQMDRIARGSVAEVLQYGPTEGLESIREEIAGVMEAEGTRVDAMDITVTTGGQQAIDLITKALIDPGDILICDAPTYPGAIVNFNTLNPATRCARFRDADFATPALADGGKVEGSAMFSGLSGRTLASYNAYPAWASWCSARLPRRCSLRRRHLRCPSQCRRSTAPPAGQRGTR